MSKNSFIEMTADVFKNGLKNKQTIGIAIIAPILIMIVLGYMVTMAGTPDPVKIGVVNYDNGIGNVSASSSIIEDLKAQDNVTVVSISQNEINQQSDLFDVKRGL